MNTCNGKNPLILVTENSEILLFSINGMTNNGGGIATFMRSKVDYLDQVIDLIEQPIKSTDCILYLLSLIFFSFLVSGNSSPSPSISLLSLLSEKATTHSSQLNIYTFIYLFIYHLFINTSLSK